MNTADFVMLMVATANPGRGFGALVVDTDRLLGRRSPGNDVISERLWTLRGRGLIHEVSYQQWVTGAGTVELERMLAAVDSQVVF